MTCALTRYCFLDTIPFKSYLEVKHAWTRFISQFGTPSLAISDGDRSFIALSHDKIGTQLAGEFAGSKERQELETEFGMRFKFNVSAPYKNGLVERIHGYLSNSILKFHQSGLRVSQFSTLVKMAQGILNRRPLGRVENNTVTPQELVTGYKLILNPKFSVQPKNIVPGTIQSKKDVVSHMQHLQFLFSKVWSKFQIEYVNSLNKYRQKYEPTKQIQVGDIVLYSQESERAIHGEYVLCKVIDITQNLDKSPRNLKVQYLKNSKKSQMSRPLRNFCLLEISDFQTGGTVINEDGL